jgi:hypothetical protein
MSGTQAELIGPVHVRRLHSDRNLVVPVMRVVANQAGDERVASSAQLRQENLSSRAVKASLSTVLCRRKQGVLPATLVLSSCTERPHTSPELVQTRVRLSATLTGIIIGTESSAKTRSCAYRLF